MEMNLVDAFELLEVRDKWERIRNGEALESDFVDVAAQKWYMMKYILGKGRK